ncbi:F0F1 ATP synthase subunit B [uncultured Thalassospira sp.]|jgi:F-type H+-transporting ATPase subunit b|uniref:F0F1 ATP synthase subunit B family protein n=1 Tax=uncultured Thalassospira sp. TaxID=404382 RepID=UPI0030DA990F|tara:strand:- start:354 stop:857 length:504 start_codon:yes stop_codon:yes gene_type:complete
MEAEHGSFFTNPETWVTLAFLVVVIFGGFKVVKGISAALDKRAGKISNELDEAQRLREEAQELLAKYQAKQREALKEADEIRAHAKAEADRMLVNAKAELEASLKRREQQALDRIGNLEAQAVAEVRAHVAEIATQATLAMVTEKVTGAKADELVDSAISEIKGRLN